MLKQNATTDGLLVKIPEGEGIVPTNGRMDTSQPLDALLLQLNPALQGWCVYFRPGVSSAVFGYLSHYTWLQGGALAAPQAPQIRAEGPLPPLLRRRLVARLGRKITVQPGEGEHDS